MIKTQVAKLTRHQIETAKLLVDLIYKYEQPIGEQPPEVLEAERRLKAMGVMDEEGTFRTDIPEELWIYISEL